MRFWCCGQRGCKNQTLVALVVVTAEVHLHAALNKGVGGQTGHKQALVLATSSSGYFDVLGVFQRQQLLYKILTQVIKGLI